MAAKCRALLLTDLVAVPIAPVLSAIKDFGSEIVSEDEVLVITQVDSLKGKLPIDSASVEVIVSVLKALDLGTEQLLEEIVRVLKPGGQIIVQTSLVSTESLDEQKSALQRKLLFAGFLEVQALEMKAFLPLEGVHSLMCGLGDAFRCGGCPYKGLPPFKLGEKVSLPGNFLVADI